VTLLEWRRLIYRTSETFVFESEKNMPGDWILERENIDVKTLRRTAAWVSFADERWQSGLRLGSVASLYDDDDDDKWATVVWRESEDCEDT